MFYEPVRAEPCESEDRAETDAPFGCPDPEYFFIFKRIGLLRRHIKRERINQRSPWHKYMRGNTNSETPSPSSRL